MAVLLGISLYALNVMWQINITASGQAQTRSARKLIVSSSLLPNTAQNEHVWTSEDILMYVESKITAYRNVSCLMYLLS